MHSENATIDGTRLKNIICTKLWEVSVVIPWREQSIKYFYCILFDSSVKINFGIFGKRKFLEKTKECKTISYNGSTNSSLLIQIAANDVFEEEEGFYSHCCYIIKSAKDGEEHEYMTQLKELDEISSNLNTEQKKRILTKIITECYLLKRANVAVLACFLSQICTPTLNIQKLIDYQYARTIFDQCSSISIQCIPKSQQVGFAEMMEQLYKCAFREGPNFLSFCIFMYPCLGPEFCLKIFSKGKWSGNGSFRLLPQVDEFAKQALKSFVRKVFQFSDPQSEFSKDRFLEKLQRFLTFDLQIDMVKELMLNKGAKLDTSFDILHSACERKLVELSKKGDIEGIIFEWNKVKCCVFLDENKLREKTEKCLLESLDKAQEHQLKRSFVKLEESCTLGTLFLETDSKIQLLRKFATSLDTNIHSLVIICLKDQNYHYIPWNEVDNIVLTWFDHASEHHCGKIFKGHKPSDSLVKLYSYFGEIVSNNWFQSHDTLLKKLDRKAFEYLKEVGVNDVMKAVPKMESKTNAILEDIFIDHIHTLFIEGIENGDIVKQELFEQIKKCEVNSK